MNSAQAKEWGWVKVRALERLSSTLNHVEGDLRKIALCCGNLLSVVEWLSSEKVPDSIPPAQETDTVKKSF